MQKFANLQMVLKFTVQMHKLNAQKSHMLLVTISREFALNIRLNYLKRLQGSLLKEV